MIKYVVTQTESLIAALILVAAIIGITIDCIPWWGIFIPLTIIPPAIIAAYKDYKDIQEAYHIQDNFIH